jgi:hypothetical protein
MTTTAPRTFTPHRANDDGSTTITLKRACNGCGQYLGDVDNRDVDDNGNLTDVRGECEHCRPLVEAEAAGCKTWQLTPRSISRVDDDLDRLGVYAKGYWEWDETEKKAVVVGLRVGTGETRVVARFGDWLIRHPDGGFTVHPAPAADRAAELLALATVLEIPRPGTGIPLQLRRSYGHSDRWAICDRTGRRWHREHGWVYEPDGIRDEAQRDATRYTLAEAEPLARELADPSRMAAEEPQS